MPSYNALQFPLGKGVLYTKSLKLNQRHCDFSSEYNVVVVLVWRFAS